MARQFGLKATAAAAQSSAEASSSATRNLTRIGVCIEQYLAGRFASIRACSPRRGVAVLACELAGRPWPAIDLSRLKLNATGRMPRGLQRTRWMADFFG